MQVAYVAKAMARHGVKPPRAHQTPPAGCNTPTDQLSERQPLPPAQATAPLAAIAAARAAALAAASSQRAAAATAEAAAGAGATTAAEAADARVTRQAMTDWAERDPISGQPALAAESIWAAADADKDPSLLPTSVQEAAAQAPVEIPNLRAAASAAATDEQMQSELLVEDDDQTLDEGDFTDAGVDLHDDGEGLEAGRDVSAEAAVPAVLPAVPAVRPAVPAALPAKLGLAELAGVVRR